MAQEIQNIESPFLKKIKVNSGLTIAIGIGLLLLGLAAMGSPLFVARSVAMMVGILLIVGGIGQLVFAFKADKQIFTIIVGVLTVLAGGYILFNQGAALATMTVLLAAYFIVSGVLDVMRAFQIKPFAGWGWLLFSGIVSVLLGAMIWSQFPLSGAWAVGILIGLRLFFTGLTLLMLGLAV